MAETCPSCGAKASGKFCNQCGAALNAACRECGTPLPRGARFCNECGASVSAQAAAMAEAAPARGGARGWLPWAVAALALVAVLLVARSLRPRQEQAAVAPPPAAATGGGDPSAVDLSSMTPREAADRLFNRVMGAASQGDSAQARQFLPMALQAAGQVEPRDNDLRYHVASLHLVGGDWDAARAEADALLAQNPRHLFGLFVAGQAAAGKGSREEARGFYQRFLDAYDAEAGRDVPEYNEHRQALPLMREEARKATAGG